MQQPKRCSFTNWDELWPLTELCHLQWPFDLLVRQERVEMFLLLLTQFSGKTKFNYQLLMSHCLNLPAEIFIDLTRFPYIKTKLRTVWDELKTPVSSLTALRAVSKSSENVFCFEMANMTSPSSQSRNLINTNILRRVLTTRTVFHYKKQTFKDLLQKLFRLRALIYIYKSASMHFWEIPRHSILEL